MSKKKVINPLSTLSYILDASRVIIKGSGFYGIERYIRASIRGNASKYLEDTGLGYKICLKRK